MSFGEIESAVLFLNDSRKYFIVAGVDQSCVGNEDLQER